MLFGVYSLCYEGVWEPTCYVFHFCRGCAVDAVPTVAAVLPRQFGGHRREEVVDGPGDNDVVVDSDQRVRDDHRVAEACNDVITTSRHRAFASSRHDVIAP